MDITEIGCEIMDWIQFDQDRVKLQALVNLIMNLWSVLTSWMTVSFTRS